MQNDMTFKLSCGLFWSLKSHPSTAWAPVGGKKVYFHLSDKFDELNPDAFFVPASMNGVKV